MKQRNGGKIFKSIESDKVRIQSTLGKELKRVLIDLQFLNDYYDILDYTSVDYKFAYSYEKQYVQNKEGQPQNQNYHSQAYVSSKVKDLRVEKKQPISKENFEVVKRDQDLQQVIELKIEDSTC